MTLLKRKYVQYCKLWSQNAYIQLQTPPLSSGTVPISHLSEPSHPQL